MNFFHSFSNDHFVVSLSFLHLRFTDIPFYKRALFWFLIIGLIMILVFSLMLCFVLAIWQRKENKKLLDILENFRYGNTSILDPTRGLYEQAHLLPYYPSYEFPIEKLIIGQKIGNGSFGCVWQATAKGILKSVAETKVAVKIPINLGDEVCVTKEKKKSELYKMSVKKCRCLIFFQ